MPITYLFFPFSFFKGYANRPTLQMYQSEDLKLDKKESSDSAIDAARPVWVRGSGRGWISWWDGWNQGQWVSEAEGSTEHTDPDMWVRSTEARGWQQQQEPDGWAESRADHHQNVHGAAAGRDVCVCVCVCVWGGGLLIIILLRDAIEVCQCTVVLISNSA